MRKFSGNVLILLGTCCMLSAFSLFAQNFNIEQESGLHCASVATEFSALTYTQPLPSPIELSGSDVPVTPTIVRNEGIYIQGDLYMGLLEIPSLGLNLPIHMDLNESKLNSAPCVYAGNLADNNLIIAGHNYRSHFWYIKNLAKGAEMRMTNPNGKVYHYEVDTIEILHQSQVEKMLDRDQWDLTLFTCQYPDSTQRIVVRCNRV